MKKVIVITEHYVVLNDRFMLEVFLCFACEMERI